MPVVQVEQWPGRAQSVEKDGTVRFLPVTATIKAVIEGKNGPGWKFEGDPTKDGEYTGMIWWKSGVWNKDRGAYEPYTGPHFAKGQRVNVELSCREKDGKTYYDARKIEAVAPDQASETQDEAFDREEFKAPAGSIGPKDQVPPEWKMPLDYWEAKHKADREAADAKEINICRQVVLKADAEIIVALLTKGPDKILASEVEVVRRYEALARILSHLPEKDTDDPQA